MSPADALFYLAFATLVAHELDAVDKREWRLLFVLRDLPEPAARDLFIVLHVPLVAVLLGLLGHPDAAGFWTRAALDAFMVVHATLHYALSGRPHYAFTSAPSRALIYGPAVLGALHLSLLAAGH